MFTGKNPAKIGLFDFYTLLFDEKKIRINNATYQDSPFLWEILSNFNIKVGVVNAPNTFPPQKVNGFMVCGGLLNAMVKDTDYTYPSTLRDELNKVAKGYVINPVADLHTPGKESEYLHEFKRVVNKQVNAVKHLMTKYPWDLFVYVLFQTDSVQHYFWHHMDRSHPKWNCEKSKKYGDVIKDFYKEVDSVVGELIAEAPTETNLIIVSDHGFGPLHGHFCVNEWLKKKGYLKTKSEKVQGIYGLLTKIFTGLMYSRVRNFVLVQFGSLFFLARRLLLRIVPSYLSQKFTAKGVLKYEIERLLHDIDWSETKAYGLRMGIFINLKGRDPEGIIEPGEEYERLRNEIIESLHRVRHPETGKKIITDIFKKEELYSGKYLDSAPDLIYVMDNMRYRPMEGINHGRVFIEPIVSADHRINGIFIAYGPSIKKTGKEIQHIKIYDITPTVLHILGVPIPKDMDGRVLKEIFEKESELARKPVLYQEMEEKRLARRKKGFKSEDEKKIKERLRELGYL